MEGVGRVQRVCAAAICAAVAVGGCDESRSDSNADRRGIETLDPEATFAPLVSLHPRESRMPAGASWFVRRSRLLFAEDHGCPDRKIAVGRALKEERTVVVDWLPPARLGTRGMYWRNPHDVHCGLDFYRRLFADQHTRPYDETRSERLGAREGWALDLEDRARDGEGRRRRVGRHMVVEGAPAYVDRRNEEVNGEPGLRLTYWLLYGLNEPRSADGIQAQLVHEGDWERLDVLLQRASGADAYRPVSLVLYGDDRRSLSWRDIIWIEDPRSSERTHPLLLAARGSHALAPSSRRLCRQCPAWRTWEEVADVREQPWYGFGGAWGDVGRDSPTTGPLGPHDGDWPTPGEVAKRPV